MIDGDLDRLVEAVQATLSAEGDLSAANTDLRVVLPLLKTLGWDVHGPEVVADYAVPGAADGDETVTVDYALVLDGRPTALVVTAGTGTDLDADHGRRLGAALTAAGVDRGLVTNGRSFVFVAVEDDLQRVRCSLAELPEQESLLSLYTKAAARRRRRQRRAQDRRRTAERLRDRREATVERVAEALADGVDHPIADELAAVAADFVDATTEALADGAHPRDGLGPDAAGSDPDPETAPSGESPVPHSPPDEDVTTTDTDGDAAGDGSVPAPDAGSDGADDAGQAASDGGATSRDRDPREEAAPMARNTGADEYVARFFDEHSSVGAVGTATSAGAVAQTVQYLVEQHALDNRLDLPWAPEDGDALDPSTAVVNREPVHPDGDRMVSPRQIANGYHVETAMDTDAARAVVESLAKLSGLRVMFQGEW